MSPKGGLGKGLGALIPNEFVPSGTTSDGSVPISKIIPNPQQPRQIMAEEELQELAESIREHGVLQPLIVSYDPQQDLYVLIAGERRLRAAKMAGLEFVPVVQRQATEQQRLELALIENVQRSDLSPLEAAEAYQHLHDGFNLTHEEIALRVGKSRVAVTNTMSLLKLPDAVRKALAENKITEGHARVLGSLPTSAAQVAALQTIIKKELSVRQTEELVRQLRGEKLAPKKVAEPEPEIEALEDRLRAGLGTRVTLTHGKSGGSLTIHYYSDEELNALVAQILRE